ncbi:MAG: GNAT family N-acetyltransferase [Clostridiales Family XIII bacterium]|jgi:ribosomal protein S18 acetylase RimI-like enzyme|nr:GNAT family N-acetyltransferase [Clostridiales Family XIII bacterium]
MSYKIAFASSDGIHIDRHLGEAKTLTILTIGETKSVTTEVLTTTLAPGSGGRDASHPHAHAHVNLAPLLDCEFVVAQKIGREMSKALLRNNISAIEQTGSIEEAATGIIKFKETQERRRHISRDDLVVEKAHPHELNQISAIYVRARVRMNENGIYQWDERYPFEEITRADISNGKLYILKLNDRIIGAATLNDSLEFPDATELEQVYVIHRFCIDPDFQKRGFARRFLFSLFEIAQREGIHEIHLAVAEQNFIAISSYRKAGFRNLERMDTGGFGYFLHMARKI